MTLDEYEESLRRGENAASTATATTATDGGESGSDLFARLFGGGGNGGDASAPKPGEYGAIRANGVQMKPEDFSGMGERGGVESALLNIQRDTGIESDYDGTWGGGLKNALYATGHAGAGRAFAGAMNKNLQALARGTDVDGVPLEQLPDNEVDYLMDSAGANGAGGWFRRFLGAWASGAWRGEDNIMRRWDETDGAKIEDPAERKRARIEYAREIARGMIGQTETSKQRAAAELEGREETTAGAALRGLIEQGGYTLPFIAGSMLGGTPGSFLLAGGLEGADRYNELRADRLAMDADGNIGVEAAGDEVSDAAGKALLRGIMSPTIEMVGGKAASALGGKLLGATIGKVPLFRKAGNALAATKAGRAVDAFAKRLNFLGRYTGMQGMPEEMAEELEDQVLDAAFGTDRRESEKREGETWTDRAGESFSDFFKGENLKELATSMLLMQVIGGGVGGHVADRIRSRHIDGVLREVAGVDASELKYYTADEKKAAFEAWAEGLTEDEIARKFNEGAKQVNRMVSEIRRNVGENQFAETDADAPKFNAPMRTNGDGQTLADENGNPIPDFQEVTDEAGRPVMRLYDAESGVTIDRIDMGDGDVQFRVTDAAGRVRAAETYQQAVERANQMLSGEYLSGAKRQYLESLTRPGRMLSGMDIVAGDSLRDVVDEIGERYGEEAAESVRRRIGNPDEDTSGQSFRYVLPDGRSGVAFVLGKIGSVEKMATAAMHEAGRHVGLDMLFDTPQKKADFLKKIDGKGIDTGAAARAMTPKQRRSFEGELSDIQRRHGLASRDDVFRTPEAVEELFAYFTENEFGNASLKDRFVAGLRSLYRDMFDADLSYNDADLLAMAGELNRRMRENTEAGRMTYRSAQTRLGREDEERISVNREDRRMDAERRGRMRGAQMQRNFRHPTQAVQERYEQDRLNAGHDVDPETGGEGQLEDTEMPSGQTYLPNSPSRIRREVERQRRYAQRQLEKFVDNRDEFNRPVQRTDEERRLAQEARERRIMDKYPHLWMKMSELMPDAEDEDILIACTRALREDAMNGTPGRAESDALVSYALERLENGEDLTDAEVRGIEERGFTGQMLVDEFGYRKRGDRWVYTGEYLADRRRQSQGGAQRPQNGTDILSQMRNGQRGRQAAENGPRSVPGENGTTTPANGAEAPEGRNFAPGRQKDMNLRRTTAQNAKAVEDATRAAKDAQGRIDAEMTARELKRGVMSDDDRLALEEAYPRKQETQDETRNGTAEAPAQPEQGAAGTAGTETAGQVAGAAQGTEAQTARVVEPKPKTRRGQNLRGYSYEDYAAHPDDGGTGDQMGAALLRFARDSGGLLRMPPKGAADPLSDWIAGFLDGNARKNRRGDYIALFGMRPRTGTNDALTEDMPSDLQAYVENMIEREGPEAVVNWFLETRRNYAEWAANKRNAAREEKAVSRERDEEAASYTDEELARRASERDAASEAEAEEDAAIERQEEEWDRAEREAIEAEAQEADERARRENVASRATNGDAEDVERKFREARDMAQNLLDVLHRGRQEQLNLSRERYDGMKAAIADARPVKIKGVENGTAGIVKVGDRWRVVDLQSGFYFGDGASKADAIAESERRIGLAKERGDLERIIQEGRDAFAAARSKYDADASKSDNAAPNARERLASVYAEWADGEALPAWADRLTDEEAKEYADLIDAALNVEGDDGGRAYRAVTDFEKRHEAASPAQTRETAPASAQDETQAADTADGADAAQATESADVAPQATSEDARSVSAQSAAAQSPATFKRGDTVMLRNADGQYGAVTFVKDNGDGTATVQRRTANRVPYLPAKVENLTVRTGDLSASGMKRTLTEAEREAERRGRAEDKANGMDVGEANIRWRRGDSTLDNLRRLASGKGSAEVRWRRAIPELKKAGMYLGTMSEHKARMRTQTFPDGSDEKEGAESIVLHVGDRVVKYRDARNWTQRDFDKIQWHNELFGDRTPYDVRGLSADDSWSGDYRPPRIVLEQPYVEIREGGGAEARRRLVEDLRRKFGAENVTVKGDPASERMEIDAGPYHISDLKDLNVGIDERTGDYAVWDANIEKRKGADAGGEADVRWRIGGRVGAENAGDTKSLERLSLAENMEKAGTGREEIWRKTGWWRGKDGKWRVELPDVKIPKWKIEWLENNSRVYPGEDYSILNIVNVSELLAAYPELGDVKISVSRLPSGIYAESDVKGHRIVLNDLLLRGRPNSVESTLNHELQHFVQEIEGFAKGGNAFKMGHEKYMRQAGEVEARNVQKRLAMSPDERASIPPWETQDVPEADVRWRRTYTPNQTARDAADNGTMTQREQDEVNSIMPPGGRGSTSRDRQERAAREQASRDAFARAFHNAGTWQRVGMLLDKNTRRDAWRAVKESAIRKMQDAGLDLRKYEVRRFERQFGKPMSRWTNAEKEQFVSQSTYYAMDRAYGRKENLSLKLNQNYVKPLEKQIAENRLDEAWTDERGEQNIGADGKPLSKLDVYLMALHGGEYNRMIAERTARAEGGPVLDGSGRSTEYWERQLARFRNEGFDRKAAEAVRLVHEMNKAALQQMVDSGRISQKQADKWNELSPNYVPLRNSDAAHDLFEQLLFGGDIDEQTYRKAYSGTEYNHAAGRRSLADSPVINSIQQAEWAIARSMDNESRRSLAAQVRADPRMGTVVMQMSQSDFREAQRQIAVFTQMEANGTITPAQRDRLARLKQNVADTIAGNRLLPRRRMLNQNSEVQSVIDVQGLEDDPNVGWVAFKENGDTKYIKLGHHELVDANGNATGNMDELTGNRIAKFVNGQSFVKLGGVMRFVRNLSRGFGMLRTSLSPTFLFSNFLADNGQALRNVFHSMGAGAMRTFEGHAMDMGKNGARASALRYLRGQLDPNRYAIDRFTKEWAEAGGQIGGFATESFGDIDERIAASLRRMQRRLSRGRGGWADALKDGARALGEHFQELNSAIEMATRISAYATMRENGMGVNDAVSYARDVTVNFNRKGEWTPIFNALYVFSNANIQDMQRTGMTFTGSRAAKLNGTLFVLGLLSAALGFGQDEPDDEAEGKETWEDASEHRKQNGISFRVGGKVISLPLRGLARMPYYAGHKAFEALTGRRDAKDVAADIGSFMFSAAAEPLSTTSSLAQSVAPSILRPAVELIENKSFTGAPIHRTKMSETQVASEMGRQSTSGMAVWLARTLNSLTGGNRNRSGMIDVFPETLEQIGRGLAGTLGTDLMKGVTLAKDIATFQAPATRDVPFVSRVASDMEKNSRRYHEAVTNFERDQKEYKDLAQEDPSVMAALRRNSPWFREGNEMWYNELDSLRKLNKKLMVEETKADGKEREALNELRMKTQGLFLWRLKHAPESDAPAKRAEYGQRNRLIDRMLRGRAAARKREERTAKR